MIKKFKKLFLSGALAMFITWLPFSTGIAALNDTSGHLYESEINHFYSEGFIKGYRDGSFKPDRSITRAEFSIIANRIFKIEQVPGVGFSDVPSSLWFAKEAAAAVAAGYIQVCENNSFKPGKYITRLEAAKAVNILLKNSVHTGHVSYENLSEAETAKNDSSVLQEAVLKGYIREYPDEGLRESGHITRAEAVRLLYRALGKPETDHGGEQQELRGILINASCSSTADPEKHTKACNLMPGCAASGYGIDVKQPDGTYKFYKFDERGQHLAKENILAKTQKQNNLTIIVRGIAEKDVFKVAAIAEEDDLQIFEGILIDRHCFDLMKDPSKDTKMCLMMASCAESGYGAAVKQKDGSYRFHALDENGQELCKDILQSTAKESNIIIRAKGVPADGLIEALYVTELIEED